MSCSSVMACLHGAIAATIASCKHRIRRSETARVNEGSQFYLPHTCLSTSGS